MPVKLPHKLRIAPGHQTPVDLILEMDRLPCPLHIPAKVKKKCILTCVFRRLHHMGRILGPVFPAVFYHLLRILCSKYSVCLLKPFRFSHYFIISLPVGI